MSSMLITAQYAQLEHLLQTLLKQDLHNYLYKERYPFRFPWLKAGILNTLWTLLIKPEEQLLNDKEKVFSLVEEWVGKSLTYHPELNEHGKLERIYHPTVPIYSEAAGWTSTAKAITIIPEGVLPSYNLHGIPFNPWIPPHTPAAWFQVDGQGDFPEPEFVMGSGQVAAAGTVILEPDGRVWIPYPTNQFGGAMRTLPAGRLDQGWTFQHLRATAIKETFEETGLKVDLMCHVMDVDRGRTGYIRTRFYLARRSGGSPEKMGWESQAIDLIALDKAQEILDRDYAKIVLKSAEKLYASKIE